MCEKTSEITCIDYSSDCKEVYGDFLCKCGFKERRYLNGKSKVMVFGRVWEQRLVKLIQEGEGIYPISKLLKADIATIKKYAEKNDVLDKWVPSRKYTPIEKNQNTINNVNHYDLWVDTIKGNTHLNKKEIRALIPATYTWLYRHDKQFLMEYNPTPSPLPKSLGVKADWDARDTEMLQKVILIVQNWDSENQKPQRKTKTSIGKKTQKMHWLEKYPGYFPKTLAYLESTIETVDEFQIRRVKWLLENDLSKRFVKEWEIYRKAGLRSDISDKVNVYIKGEVIQHNINVAKLLVK
ncbi:TnsD family Tn7-like transposition protein [Niallia circulans]|uniref:TnsD family Tn7-like transposition protein n=1 Tax=Niallia circulans TaxID=1397 RepID=UPI0023AB1942|nr:TnsD family Tn7-like transposition protein [Niallia circulans]